MVPSAIGGALIETLGRASGWNSAPGAELQGVPLAGTAFSSVPASAVLGVRGTGDCRLHSTAERASRAGLSSNPRPQSDGREAAHFGHSPRAPAVGPERWVSRTAAGV